MRKTINLIVHNLGGYFSLDCAVAKFTEEYWFFQLRKYVSWDLNRSNSNFMLICEGVQESDDRSMLFYT